MTDPNQDPPPVNNGNNQPPGNTTTNISRVSLKVPPFWHDSPEIWFAQIEAQFTITQTTTDNSKFNNVVGAIESKVLTQVADAVLNPPATGKYENLKAQIIARFADTEHKKMTKLLSNMALGDRKPSHMLNEMKRLGGANITEDFLKTLWLQNLTPQARAILSTSNADLNTLASLADKISEVADVNQISNVQASSMDKCAVLEKKIEQLTKAVQALTSDGNIHHSRSRSASRHKQRSSTPAKEDSKKVYDYCWYHYRFGKDARKPCNQPCKFDTSKN